ncbi:hypothetical protein N802_04200 [Knoellia sinensis KCTC 19936]|uniref:Uncharacterized protein n=1 Tax=Knoellia sinensis KCTC 19936 TaxID=1385520 RepID=A0A0A0J6Q8_9MICO|nr:hypothetical protein [Knoellia sinensis]KGN31296.1 hypothetical protein N802_04200 [Knoellia sinensis KCTC 19936]
MKIRNLSSVLAVTAVTASLALPGLTSGISASSDSGGGSSRIDVAALALAAPHATPAMDSIEQNARLKVRPRKAPAQANSVAGATADCDGCTATASALTIVSATDGGHPYSRVKATGRAVVDNMATTTTSDCTGCGTVAVSLQVVLARTQTLLSVNNRSIAVNAGCTECKAASAAYQIVIVSEELTRLTQSDRAELRAFLASEVDRLKNAAPQARQSMAGSALDDLEDRLRASLGPAATVTGEADVKLL